jgi:SAM-dependent methyltransferase
VISVNRFNRRIFDLGPARWVGGYIYNWRRPYQLPVQSTTTKFFRNLKQLSALAGPLSSLTSSGKLSALVVGCSYGCEAFSLAGLLALKFPSLDWEIVGVDISREALAVAQAAHYTAQYGLGTTHCDLARQLENRIFVRSGAESTVVADIRERVRFTYGDVLSAQFQDFKSFDLVLGQNFMIHMDDGSAKIALASLVAATKSGGVLFLGGMDLDTKAGLLVSHGLVPLDWNIIKIHEADDMRRSAWPWSYWSLEPISPKHPDYLRRYSTIFFKP